MAPETELQLSVALPDVTILAESPVGVPQEDDVAIVLNVANAEKFPAPEHIAST